MKTTKFIILTILTFFILSCNTLESDKQKLSQLNNYYQKALNDWNVPGMAVGIIKNGQLIFAKGYGTKDVNEDEKIDTKTNFAIASNTKAFTAAAIMILQEEGKLDLDDKVQKYLPWFELYDPYVSKEMTIRDLLCHRSGLATFSGDLIWMASDHSQQEIVRRARFLKPKYGFREAYGYSNIMYTTAGLIIEKVSKMSWDEFMQSHFFAPLGMERTITSITDLDKMGNYTQPHLQKNGEIIKVPYMNWDNVKPMGGIISNIEDVSKWVRLQLNEGILGTDTIFSKKSQDEMFSQHIARSVNQRSKDTWPSIHFKGYGLGWGMFDYKGRKIIMHTGGYEGTITATVLVPEENLGLIFLTNKITSLYSPLMYKTLDVFFNEQEKDWSGILLKEQKKSRERENKTLIQPDTTKTIIPLALTNYSGNYKADVYGGLTVSIEDNQLYLSFDHTKILHSRLSHLNGNIFEIEFPEAPSLPKGMVEFYTNKKGKVQNLLIEIINPDFDFTELDFIKQN